MPLTPQLKHALADRIRYYNELGIYDFYRREGEQQIQIQPEQREPLPKAKAAAIIPVDLLEAASSRVITLRPSSGASCHS